MNDEERKMVAYLAGMLLTIGQRTPDLFTFNENVSIENIASELGYFDLHEKEFRY